MLGVVQEERREGAGGSGGGCCGGRNKATPPSTSNPSVLRPAETLASVQPPTSGGGCCSGKTATQNEDPLDGSEMSLMEMMDKLTNGTAFDKQPMEEQGGGCQCKDPNEGVRRGCCVVICLKTLETLKFLVMQKESLVACKSQAKNGSGGSSGNVKRASVINRCNNNNLACCQSPAVCN